MIINLFNGMDFKDDISVSNYMDTFFLCHVGKNKLCEKMVQEHTLFHLVSGEMDVQTPEGVVRLRRGDTCFLRRNHRVNKEKRPAKDEPFNGIFLHPNTNFLRRVKEDYRIAIPLEIIKANMVEYHEARWKKAVWNMTFNGMSVVLNADTDQLVNNAAIARLLRLQMKEIIHAAHIAGVKNIRVPSTSSSSFMASLKYHSVRLPLP